MFDISFIDKLTDEDIAAGTIRTGVFDKRVLFPIAQLSEWVERETGEPLAPERVPELVRAGWFPVLSSEMVGVDEGFPMYAPSRVGLLLKLERQGFSSAELEAFAAFEEGVIDDILTDDETPYEDDDLTLLQMDQRARLANERAQLEFAETYSSEEARATVGHRQHIEQTRAAIKTLERTVRVLDGYAARGGIDALPHETQNRLRRNAARMRWSHEMVRVMLIEQDRAQLGAGYSHFIQFRRTTFPGTRLESYTFSGIDWRLTLQSPWSGARDEDDALPIRLPGVLLEGEQVTLTRRTSHQEYRKLMEEYDIEGYHRALAALQGERLCARCLAVLPVSACATRRYCGEACRSAARVAAWRKRHPDFVNMDRHGVARPAATTTGRLRLE